MKTLFFWKQATFFFTYLCCYKASEMHVSSLHALKNCFFFSLFSFTGSSPIEELLKAVGSWRCLCPASLPRGSRAQGAYLRVKGFTFPWLYLQYHWMSLLFHKRQKSYCDLFDRWRLAHKYIHVFIFSFPQLLFTGIEITESLCNPLALTHILDDLLERLCLWVLLWHPKSHLFRKGLLSAVVDVEGGRAATVDFNCSGVSFLPFVLFPGKYFNSPRLDWLQLCWGGGVSCLWSSSICCCLYGAQRAGHSQGSTAHKSGLPWRSLFPSTVTEECAETAPECPVPPVLRVSEKLRPYSLERIKLFFLPR